DGAVWRNGHALRVQSRTLDEGDVIDIVSPDIEVDAPLWRPEDLELVFEDRWLAVANKKAGVLTQPSENSRTEELALDQHLLLWMAYRDGKKPFLRTIHRLDRLTSGLVVFARNPQALAPLDRSWRTGKVDRFYLALVEGCPADNQGVIDAPIRRDRGHAWRFEVERQGKASRTHFRVVHREDRWSAVLCRLETGRTHQVRVHLAHLGHPVLGDHLYGSTSRDAPRPLLHAWALDFPHPGDNSPLRLIAPLPSLIAMRLGENAPSDPWSLT
ncbi:MAG: RluA family pseudouridine synthase, partial [Acidobacteriota bacterium]